MISTELTEQIKYLNEEIVEMRKPHEKIINQNKLLTQIFFLKWKYLSSLINLRKKCENSLKQKLKNKKHLNFHNSHDTKMNQTGRLNKHAGSILELMHKSFDKQEMEQRMPIIQDLVDEENRE